MTFELDTLIAIAFLAPVVFFAVLDIVAFRAFADADATPRVGQDVLGAEKSMGACPEAANEESFLDAA